MNIVIVAATLDVLDTIIGEAGISLLGAGLKPPASSLGLMISDAQPNIYSPAWTESSGRACARHHRRLLLVRRRRRRDAFDPRTKD